MADMTRREQELQGLYELRNNQIALAKREQEMEALCKKQDKLEADIQREANGMVTRLPEDGYWKYRKVLEKKEKRRKYAMKAVAFLGVVLMGIWLSILLRNNEAAAAEMNGLLWVCFYTGILVLSIISCSDEIPSIVITISIFTAAPLIPFIASVYIMIASRSFIPAIPLAMMIGFFLIGRRTQKYQYRYNANEKRLLAAKQADDSEKRQMNRQKASEAENKVRAKYAAAADSLKKDLERCNSEIAVLKSKVQNNGWLYGDDIQWADKVADYIQSRRADSIKEALHLVDVELERERQRKLEEQRHKEIMEELEFQSWEAARMREEQREAAERAEKAMRDSEAAAERARYDAEMRAYEENWKADQHRQNVEWELRKMRDDG